MWGCFPVTWRWRSWLDSQKHNYGKWSDHEVERATKIYSSKDQPIRGYEDELSFKHVKTVSSCRNRIKSQQKQRIKDIVKHDLSMINRSKELWFEAGNCNNCSCCPFLWLQSETDLRGKMLSVAVHHSMRGGCWMWCTWGRKRGSLSRKCTEWVPHLGRFPSSSTNMVQIKKINEEFLNVYFLYCSCLLKELFTT